MMGEGDTAGSPGAQLGLIQPPPPAAAAPQAPCTRGCPAGVVRDSGPRGGMQECDMPRRGTELLRASPAVQRPGAWVIRGCGSLGEMETGDGQHRWEMWDTLSLGGPGGGLGTAAFMGAGVWPGP